MIDNKGSNNPMFGKKHSEETKQKMRQARLGKKGFKHTEETKEKLRVAKLGENNPSWKGDNMKYKALHRWIRTHNPPPDKCQNCNETKELVLANITGNYTRDIKNYKYLCHLCHHNYDMESHKIDPTNGRWIKLYEESIITRGMRFRNL